MGTLVGRRYPPLPSFVEGRASPLYSVVILGLDPRIHGKGAKVLLSAATGLSEQQPKYREAPPC
ncbi:hypothetical protein C7477_11146 [Phyllobacterium leguminum]|uniref:Uncharacterized protein n=1 Tax=Phyllobacterium leguminum TaxID=314237 RepID=A0A318T462_9HYPH|nr:hypothetical protein C7477_11146 [Phyllobacterium leguminum]